MVSCVTLPGNWEDFSWIFMTGLQRDFATKNAIFRWSKCAIPSKQFCHKSQILPVFRHPKMRPFQLSTYSMKSCQSSWRLLACTFLKEKNRWLLNIGYAEQLVCLLGVISAVSWRSLIIIFYNVTWLMLRRQRRKHCRSYYCWHMWDCVMQVAGVRSEKVVVCRGSNRGLCDTSSNVYRSDADTTGDFAFWLKSSQFTSV